MSVVIFLVGLVSEQISSLRFEGRRPMTTRTALVIVPTYNERENLPVLTKALMQHSRASACWSWTTSRPDGTGAVADALALEYPGRIEVMHRTARRGLGRSYIDGIARGARRGRSTSSARWTPISRTTRRSCRI